MARLVRCCHGDIAWITLIKYYGKRHHYHSKKAKSGVLKEINKGTKLNLGRFYIQVKPTAIYLIFGLSLLIGVARGKALLKTLLAAAFDGLDDKGWMILSRNWGIFFLFLAALNEGFRHYLSFGGWLQSKLYVFLPLSFVFTFLHMPMLLRHGMGEVRPDDVIEAAPHE